MKLRKRWHRCAMHDLNIAGVGSHGAKDRVASEFHVVDCFDEGVEPGMEIFAPLEEKASGAGVPIEGAIVGEIVVLSELPRGAPVKEFFFDGFALGMVADDALTAVAFEGGLHFQLLSPADGARRFSGEGAVEFASDSAGGFLTGGLSIGIGGSGHLSCPFWDSRAAGGGRVSYEVGGRSILFSRFSSTDWRRPTFVQSPISYLLIGLLASGAI